MMKPKPIHMILPLWSLFVLLVWLLAFFLLSMFTRHDRDGLDQGKYGWALFSSVMLDGDDMVAQVRAQMIKHMSKVTRYASSRYHAGPRVVYNRAVKRARQSSRLLRLR